MEAARLVLIVTQEVRQTDAGGFARYEAKAVELMARHGGRMERVIRVQGERGDGMFREVHLVSFPDEAAFEAYRQDPALVALRDLRDRVIHATAILRGHDISSPGGVPQ